MKSNRNNRRMNFESMEKRELFAADLGMDLALATEPAPAAGTAEIDFVEVGGGESSEAKPMCYLKYKLERAFIKSWSTSGDADAEPTQAVKSDSLPNDDGDVTTAGWDHSDYFVADSFSFGVEREMKESGEKGGTEDINIGVGELQECTVSKSMDMASMDLAQYAINGNSCGTAEIDFVEVAGESGGGPHVKVFDAADATDASFRELAGETNEAGDTIPTDQFSFNFTKIEFDD